MIRLFAENPLWLALVVVTIAVHVGFFVALRRLFGGPGPKPPDAPGAS